MTEPRSESRLEVAVDCVLFGYDEHDLRVLLVERGHEPFAGEWALPGGLLKADETLDQAARRGLLEEAGVGGVYLEQLYSFGDPGRDPRGRVVSVAYYALVHLGRHPPRPRATAHQARWFPAGHAPRLASDHDRILAAALARVRAKVRYQPIGFELLPERFTLSQLRRLYETVLGREIDRSNFRKKVIGLGLLEDLGPAPDRDRTDPRGPRPRLYRFDPARYRALEERGFSFEI